jgi:hypothetical protein
MDLREIGRDFLDWMHPAQDRELCRSGGKMVMKCRVPYKAENFFQVEVFWVVTPCSVVVDGGSMDL